MGPFITAYIMLNGPTRTNRLKAAQWLEAFREHVGEAGLGQVSEIFDGDPPHRPRGCIAQAWSVAELLRAAVEDIYGLKPVTPGATAASQGRAPLQSGKRGRSP
jgi:glycogen debranching enzyme